MIKCSSYRYDTSSIERASSSSSSSTSMFQSPSQENTIYDVNSHLGQRIWTHVRTICGIVKTHFSQPPIDNTQEMPPNFNAFANWYFKSHGYTSSTLWIFFHIWGSNKDSEDKFVDALWNYGVPRTEAEWIGSLLYK